MIKIARLSLEQLNGQSIEHQMEDHTIIIPVVAKVFGKSLKQ